MLHQYMKINILMAYSSNAVKYRDRFDSILQPKKKTTISKDSCGKLLVASLPLSSLK